MLETLISAANNNELIVSSIIIGILIVLPHFMYRLKIVSLQDILRDAILEIESVKSVNTILKIGTKDPINYLTELITHHLDKYVANSLDDKLRLKRDATYTDKDIKRMTNNIYDDIINYMSDDMLSTIFLYIDEDSFEDYLISEIYVTVLNRLVKMNFVNIANFSTNIQKQKEVKQQSEQSN